MTPRRRAIDDYRRARFVRPEELMGLAGTMGITIAGGKHSYQFDYTLPAAV